MEFRVQLILGAMGYPIGVLIRLFSEASTLIRLKPELTKPRFCDINHLKLLQNMQFLFVSDVLGHFSK